MSMKKDFTSQHTYLIWQHTDLTSGRTMPAYVELITDKSVKRYEKWTNRYDKIVYKLTSLSYKLLQKYVIIQGFTNPEIVCTKIVSGSFKVTSCE